MARNTYPKEAKALINTLLTRCDRLYWGEECTVGVRPVNREDTINWWAQCDRDSYQERLRQAKRVGAGYLRKLGPRLVLWHCQGHRTVYYTSNPNSHINLVLLDLDDKDGTAGDAMAAGEFLRANYFRHSFSEGSTHGKGFHVYFLLLNLSLGARPLRAFLETFFAFLRARLAAAGFKSALDKPKGTPSVYSGRMIRKGDGGVLGKFPRELLTRFAEFPDEEYSVEELMEMMKTAEPPASRSQALQKLTPAVPAVVAPNIPSDDISESQLLGRNLTGPERRLQFFNYYYNAHPDAILPDLISSYRGTYYHESTDARAQAIWRSDFSVLLHKEDQRRREGSYMGTTVPLYHRFSFNPERYLPIIRHLITVESLRNDAKERVTHQKLADFTAVKIQDAFFSKDQPRYLARASRDATIRNFRKLKAKGKVDWVPNNSLYKLLLDLTIQHDLLKVYDEHVPPTRASGKFRSKGVKVRKGYARAIGPGGALPEEYEAFEKLWTNRELNVQRASA